MSIADFFKILFVVFTVCLLGFCSFSNAAVLHRRVLRESNEACEQSTIIQRLPVNFTSGNYTIYGEIYYPINESEQYPAIVFCEGFAGYVSAYNWVPTALAEHGYVVLIFDPPGQGFSEGDSPIRACYLSFLNLYIRPSLFVETPIHFSQGNWITTTQDAITFLIEQSPVIQLINTTCVGLIGHSLGGITVTQVAAKDTRVDTVVALSQGDLQSISEISVPIQFQGGGLDYSTHSISILLSCYPKANTPKELIFIEHGTHFGFTTAFGMFCPCPQWQKNVSLRYAIGWFDYFLKHKTEAYETITTGIDHLSNAVQSRYNFGDEDHFLN